MKKLLIIGVVITLALSLGAGAVFAGSEGDTPTPDIGVTNFVQAVVGGASVISNVTIENLGNVNASITSINSTVYWQEDGEEGDAWKEVGKNVDVAGYEIAVGGELEQIYTISYDVPPYKVPGDAGLLKNEVLVEVEFDGIEGTIVYNASMTLALEGEEDESDGEGEGGDAEPVVKSQAFRAGNSHCWHFNLGHGESGRLNCQIKDGYLTGVFNGKGLQSGTEYCLSYKGVCLGSATANKAGKVHFKAGGEVGDGETSENISLVECGTE